jgi:hypothetical protein
VRIHLPCSSHFLLFPCFRSRPTTCYYISICHLSRDRSSAPSSRFVTVLCVNRWRTGKVPLRHIVLTNDMVFLFLLVLSSFSWPSLLLRVLSSNPLLSLKPSHRSMDPFLRCTRMSLILSSSQQSSQQFAPFRPCWTFWASRGCHRRGGWSLKYFRILIALCNSAT